MRTIFIISFCFMLNAAKAQDVTSLIEHAYVNGIRIDSIHAKYAQALANFTQDFSVRFQYGQGTSKKEELITTIDGNAVKFHSAADLLNFLDRNGWDLVPVGVGGPASITFILKKKDAAN